MWQQVGWGKLASLHFKTKIIKSKATFLVTSFLKFQIIRLVEVLWNYTPTQATPMKKTFLAVHFTKMYSFVNTLTETFWVLCQNMLEIQTKFPLFSLHNPWTLFIYLLDIGLLLTISKVLTILFLHFLWE